MPAGTGVNRHAFTSCRPETEPAVAGPSFRFSQLAMCFMCSGFRLGLMDLDITDALQCP